MAYFFKKEQSTSVIRRHLRKAKEPDWSFDYYRWQLYISHLINTLKPRK